MKTVDRASLQAILSDGKPVRLLEALPPKYYHEGHLPGAKQLDYANAAAHAGRLRVSRNDRVVIYCASATCENSHKAAEALTAAGFTDVSVYVGGKKDWTDAGLALEGARDAA